MDTGQAFLLLETTATIFMAGVLWTMQLLNYPLLALVGAGLRTCAAAGRDHFHGSAAGPPARGARGRLRPADAQPARSLQLDTSGRLVGGGRYRAVDVPPGVHAMSADHRVAPGRPATQDHDQRHRANPSNPGQA